MTLKEKLNLPLPTKGSEDQFEYLNKLVRRLEDSYVDQAEILNRTYKTSTEASFKRWLPIIVGSTTDGVADDPYVRQFGWSARSALMTDIFFELSWTGHTGEGDLQILLPYTVADSLGGTAYQANIFIGAVLPGSIAAPGGQVAASLEAISGSTRATLVSYTLGGVKANVQISDNRTGSLQGSLRYVGKRNS